MTEDAPRRQSSPATTESTGEALGPMGCLYYGDNLDILPRYVQNESVDLVYLDPPFKSDQDYNVLFAERDGTMSAAQIKAFEDTWVWDLAAASLYEQVVERGGKLSEALQAFRKLLGANDMLAYLVNMAPRLAELHRVLKPSGSLYLHCDPTASHYLKVLLDAIFGAPLFRNEIIWRRTGAHNPRRSFGPIHDTILFYAKDADYYFQINYRPYMKGHVERRYRKDSTGKLKFTSGGNVLSGAGATSGPSGRVWRGFDPSAKGRHWAIPGFLKKQMPPEFEKLDVLQQLEQLYQAGLVEILPGAAWPTPVRYLAGGQPLSDVWAYQPYTEGTVYDSKDGIDSDVKWLGPTDPERLGYQTQKPLGLLERIISSSCPPGGVVLDPFCGCGTTVAAAQKLKLNWIGIDITCLAINLIKRRLADMFGPAASYRVVGEPTALQDAIELAQQNRYQFQWWALGLVGARPTEEKRGPDQGIDGRLYFHDEARGGKSKQIVISVKSGKVGVKDVRDLAAVRTREKAELAALITLEPPTRPMRAEAASVGNYKSPLWKTAHPRLQIITVEQLLSGERLDYPAAAQTNVTLRRAKAPPPRAHAPRLPFE